MAEESIYSLVTPQKNEFESMNTSEDSAGIPVSSNTGRSTHAGHRRATIGSYHAGDSSLRNSTEKSDSAKSSRNVVPNYLRASTGSCHDFCKYGREHSFEEKARKPLRKKIAKPLPEDLHSVEIFVSGGPKKEKGVNQRHPTDPKNHSPDLRPSPDTRSYSAKPKTSVDREKAMKLRPSEDTKNRSPCPLTITYSQKSKMLSAAKPGNKTLVPKYKSSSAKKLPAADPPEIVKSVFFPSIQVENSLKQGSSIDDKISRGEKEKTYVSKQHSSPVKSKTIMVKPSSSQNSDGIRLKGRRNSNPGTGRNLTALKAPVKKVLTAPTATLSPKVSLSKPARVTSGKAGNLKLVSLQKDRRSVKTKLSDNEKVSEKTLHVIKTETENNVSESLPGVHAVSSLPIPLPTKSFSSANSLSSSSHEEDNAEIEGSVGEAAGFISDDNDSHEIAQVLPPVKENNSKALRKSRMVASEDKHRAPLKLKFRSGKVVDPQSENNGPRRLRFRRARVLGAEDGKGDLRRTLKKAEANNDATGAKVSSEKVVLKHQDVQGKKDAQGLFNNVIEETASKLVESRKSKVKALVGAFETVISLQETKPSSQVVS